MQRRRCGRPSLGAASSPPRPELRPVEGDPPRSAHPSGARFGPQPLCSAGMGGDGAPVVGTGAGQSGEVARISRRGAPTGHKARHGPRIAIAVHLTPAPAADRRHVGSRLAAAGRRTGAEARLLRGTPFLEPFDQPTFIPLIEHIGHRAPAALPGILLSLQKAQLCNPCTRNELSPLSQEGHTRARHSPRGGPSLRCRTTISCVTAFGRYLRWAVGRCAVLDACIIE
jgi:hypothetical protein